MYLFSTFLLLAPFLACPLMMGLCFFGMRRMGGATSPNTATPSAASFGAETHQSVVALEERLARLQVEQAEIAEQLSSLRNGPMSGTSRVSPVIGLDRSAKRGVAERPARAGS